MEGEAVRTLVVWCPDWALVAAGVPSDVPAVALRANRVVACTPAARAEGVAVEQRRRDAQARCPELVVVEDDPRAAGRSFEPVAASLEALTPRLEIVAPGCCALPTRGPSRYHGGDLALAHLAASLTTREVAAISTGKFIYGTQVGVADGLFAATLAAKQAPVDVQVVPPGESAAFLAPLLLATLDRPDLVDVLRRLGLRRLGDFAALPASQVVGRFGSEGLTAQRLARGLDERPPATVPPPPDLHVVAELDPPIDRIEAAAFVMRGLADDLHRRLEERGSACTRLLVGVETEHGERHERLWRTEGIFGPAAIADRLRWQLEGWLQQSASRIRPDDEPEAPTPHQRPAPPNPPPSSHLGPPPDVQTGLSPGVQTGLSGGEETGLSGAGAGRRRHQHQHQQHQVRRQYQEGAPSGGLARLWLVPDEVVPAGGRQLSFSTGTIDEYAAGERAGRALARVQGLVGVEAVTFPEWRGGRGPGERVAWVQMSVADLTEPRPAARREWVSEPWPGAVPEPGPALVHPQPLPAEVHDPDGNPLRVSGRGVLSADPGSLAIAGRSPQPLVSWSAPWPCEERWWDPATSRRRARLQVITADRVAHLLVVENGRWAVEATYD